MQHSPDPQSQDEEHQPEAAGVMQLPPHDQERRERRMAPTDPPSPSLDSPKLSWAAQSPVLRYPEAGTFQDEQSLMKIDSYLGPGDLDQHHMDTGRMSMLFDFHTASHNLPQGVSDRDSTEQWQFFPDSDLVVVGAPGTSPTPPSSSSERATIKSIGTDGTTSMEGQQRPSPSRSAKRGRENTSQGSDRLSSSSCKDSEAPCPNSCLCQQRIVFLIDELEMQLADGSAIAEVENIDAALATHKEAVRFAELMLACQKCSKQLENMTLLYLLAQRQVRLCEAIVTAYLDGMKRWSEPGCRQVVRFGEYELDSRAEWSLLLGNAIMLQLRALFSIVGKINGNEHIQGPRLKILASIRHLLGKARIDSPNPPGWKRRLDN